jgi:MAF protein
MAGLPEFGLTLASGSPRRSELLDLTGWEFDTCQTRAEETRPGGEEPRSRAVRLAMEKAEAAERVCPENSMTLAADTLVAYREKILGKPRDAGEAAGMLEELRGRQHLVITAIVLTHPEQGPQIEVCETAVPMRDYSDQEQAAYIAGGSPFDKAGAYGIQDQDFSPVEVGAMHGCYANVMGLPLCHLVRAMRKFGQEPPVDVPAACQRYTGYDCDVYNAILEGEL